MQTGEPQSATIDWANVLLRPSSPCDSRKSMTGIDSVYNGVSSYTEIRETVKDSSRIRDKIFPSKG